MFKLRSVVQITSPLQLKEKCILCKNDFTITELRAHLENCEKSDKVQDDTSDKTTGVPEQAETVQDDNLDQTRTDAQEIGADMDQHTESDNDELPRLYPPPPRVTEETVTDESPLQQAITSCIDICTKNRMTDPIDILRSLQDKIVIGRDLDLASEETTIEGETNFIVINRHNLLQSAFDEISDLANLRFTLEVQFAGEVSSKAHVF